MMRKKIEKKESHNIGTHKEKMFKRRAVQKLRSSKGMNKDTSKYTPSYEDRKHHGST